MLSDEVKSTGALYFLASGPEHKASANFSPLANITVSEVTQPFCEIAAEVS
jgi:hypothetical protein